MVKVKNVELDSISSVLAKTQEQKLVNKVGFFILQANAVVTRELEPYFKMRELVQTHESIKKFSKEKEALLVKHAYKDEKGNPVITKGERFSEYQIENQVDFSKELEVLLKEHEEGLKEYNDVQEKFKLMGEEEVEFKFDKKISFKDIPDEVFSIQDLYTLQKLIKEPIEDWEA